MILYNKTIAKKEMKKDKKYANNNESIIRGCSLNLIKNNHRLY